MRPLLLALCLLPLAVLADPSGPPAEPRANRWAVEPIRVPPPTITSPARPAPAAAPGLPLPPVAIERPASITSCDAHGCWTSDGARLQRIGPGLGGPCSSMGTAAFCQ